MDFKLRKEERLKSRKIISRLFNREGISFSVYPLRLVYLETPLKGDFPIQFTVSVPKRSFKHAVDRNRLRRQLKEIYRLNKHRLYASLKEEERQFAVMLLYTGKTALPFEELEDKLKYALRKLGKRLQSTNRNSFY